MNIMDHYWNIGGSATEVYSSKTNTLVPVSDAAYVAWRDMYGDAKTVPTWQELGGVLQPNDVLPDWLFTTPYFIQPAPGVYDKDQLGAYAADANARKNSSGITVNSQPFATDPVTMMSLNSAFIYTQGNAASTFSWKLPDGSFVTLNKAQVEDLQNAVAKFGQDCYGCEDQTLTGIAGGSITTLEQIDAAFAAVNSVFTSATAFEVRHRRKK